MLDAGCSHAGESRRDAATWPDARCGASGIPLRNIDGRERPAEAPPRDHRTPTGPTGRLIADGPVVRQEADRRIQRGIGTRGAASPLLPFSGSTAVLHFLPLPSRLRAGQPAGRLLVWGRGSLARPILRPFSRQGWAHHRNRNGSTTWLKTPSLCGSDSQQSRGGLFLLITARVSNLRPNARPRRNAAND